MEVAHESVKWRNPSHLKYKAQTRDSFRESRQIGKQAHELGCVLTIDRELRAHAYHLAQNWRDLHFSWGIKASIRIVQYILSEINFSPAVGSRTYPDPKSPMSKVHFVCLMCSIECLAAAAAIPFLF